MCPRTGKESCKFFGSPTEFTDLMEHALKLEGNWTQTKDPENHKIFKADNAAISWWNSTKTLSISGKRENDIRKQLKALVQKGKSAVDHTYNISQEDISSDQPPLHQSTTAETHNSSGYQQEFRNIWETLRRSTKPPTTDHEPPTTDHILIKTPTILKNKNRPPTSENAKHDHRPHH